VEICGSCPGSCLITSVAELELELEPEPVEQQLFAGAGAGAPEPGIKILIKCHKNPKFFILKFEVDFKP
jgi:hypothetical protein